MQIWLKKRCKELSSRIAIFIPIVPTIYPLTPTWTLVFWAVAIVVFAVPEDKMRRGQ